MASEHLLQSLLIILLLFVSIARIFFLWNFKSDFSGHKIYLTLCISTVILSAILLGLFWSNRLPLWCQILLGVTSTLPSLQEFLRVNCQQLNNPLIPQYIQRLFLSYAFISTLLKILATFVGAFLLDSIHHVTLFLSFSDYLGITAWYWWLGRSATQTKRILRSIIAHFSCLSILLLAVAIVGTVSKIWIIAIEIQLIFSSTCAISLQFITSQTGRGITSRGPTQLN